MVVCFDLTVQDYLGALRAVELVVDVVFTLDIWFNFRTAYYNSSNRLETNPTKIAKHYLRTW